MGVYSDIRNRKMRDRQMEKNILEGSTVRVR